MAARSRAVAGAAAGQRSPAPSSGSSSPAHVYDCVVVGAGLSGLSAACYLHSHSVTDFVVLEARQRVGGRTCTIKTTDGRSLDVGGAYVGPTQNRILRVLHNYGLPTAPVYDSGKTVTTTSTGRYVHDGSIPPLSPLSLLDLNHCLVATERQRKQIRPDRPHESAELEGMRLDEMTAQQWAELHCDTAEGREMYCGVVRAMCCVEACEVSALSWLHSVASCGGTERMIEIEGGAQERTIAGGSQQVSERMRDTIGTDRVLTGKVVTAVDWDASRSGAGVSEATDGRGGADSASLTVSASCPPIVVRCADGSSYAARRVIVAVSPALYSTIRWQPYLPSWKRQPAARMHMGSVIKTIMTYSRSWWRNAGYSGSTFNSTPDAVSTGCIDDCDAATQRYSLVGFITGASYQRTCELTSSQRRELIAQQYRDAFDSELALSPLSYTECDWTAEEYSRGGYSAVCSPLAMTQARDGLTRSLAGLHWAASELAVHWPGYMTGAIESGERAAHEVLHGLAVPTLGEWVLDEPEGQGWDCVDITTQQQLTVFPAWEELLPRARTACYTALAAAAAVTAGLAWHYRRTVH